MRKMWPVESALRKAPSNWFTGSPLTSRPFGFSVQIIPFSLMSRSTRASSGRFYFTAELGIVNLVTIFSSVHHLVKRSEWGGVRGECGCIFSLALRP
jgi:hypothetical protein